MDTKVTRVQRHPADFLALTRPRVVVMVLVTTLVGFYLASVGAPDYVRLVHTLIGIALAAGGTLALNQYLERDVDARMKRTRLRPLPDGRLQPIEALGFGVAITGVGLLYLAFSVNVLSAFVTAFSVGSYLFLYTPLKRKTSLCSVVGAVPGALPPVIGWGAARGELGLEAWVLLASYFSGRSRIPWPSPGCIGTTMPGRASACCRWSSRTGGARGDKLSATAWHCWP